MCLYARRARAGAVLGLGLALSVACAEDAPSQDNLCGLTTDPSTGNATLVASSAHNYAFSSTLSLPLTPVAPQSDLSFDWSSVTEDMLGHAVDPLTDVDQFNLLLWALTKDDLELKLNSDQLSQKDLVAIATLDTQRAVTHTTTRDLTSFGQPINHDVFIQYFDAVTYPPDQYTYTAMVASGTIAGQGIHMLGAFHLDPASSETQVRLDNESTELSYAVDLRSLQPTSVSVASAKLAIDWSGLDGQLNALGQPFVSTRVTRAKIAAYALPVDELESRFLDLDLIAEHTWRLEIASGTVADFSLFKDEAGSAFTGIDGGHTWLLALECGSCRNPAPWYLTVLAPCNSPR